MTTTKQTKINDHVGFDVHKEIAKLWTQMSKQNEARELSTRRMPRLAQMPAIIVHQCNREGSSGCFYQGEYKITLSLGRDTVDAWEVIAHELNHAAGFQFHDRLFYKSLKAIIEKRWKTRISFYEVTRYGYEVDSIMRDQLKKNNCVNFEKKKASV